LLVLRGFLPPPSFLVLKDCGVLEDFSNLVSCWFLRIDCWVLEDFSNLVSCWFLRIDCWVLEDFSNVLSYRSLRITRSLWDFSNAASLLQPIIFGVVVKMLNGTKNKVSCIYKGRTLGKRYGIKVWVLFLSGNLLGMEKDSDGGKHQVGIIGYWISNC
jgi:hypothetical protein